MVSHTKQYHQMVRKSAMEIEPIAMPEIPDPVQLLLGIPYKNHVPASKRVTTVTPSIWGPTTVFTTIVVEEQERTSPHCHHIVWAWARPKANRFMFAHNPALVEDGE